MSYMSQSRARREIHDLIRDFEGRRAANDPRIAKLKRGKLYELFVLSWLLGELLRRGFSVSLHGTVLSLKQSPGAIKSGDTYFEIMHSATSERFRVYTDIEVRTLGSTQAPTTDLSGHHEIDIVVVEQHASGRPSHLQLALGIECKSHVKFRKAILKEALGIKRETGLLSNNQPSVLARAAGQRQPAVPADPSSEYLVCYVDQDGDRYAKSPAAFGIEFKLLRP